MKFSPSKRSLFKATNKVVVKNLLPWIIDPNQFIENCTQCADCINVCPENIIEKGDGGYPSINFNKGECSFCGECANICKETIFTMTEHQPWLKKAHIEPSCLANLNVYCRSCADSCEVQALSFQLGVNAIPNINLELCTGCGACVSPCPTQAIQIKEIS